MENLKVSETVLVTGGSGFIASYCIIALLSKGYKVKASLRSLNRVADVKQMLSVGGIQDFDNLSFVQADLSHERGWKEAAEGCSYIIHPASPTPNPAAKHEDEFIIPAVNGVLFVLRAAKAAGVKRVVLTSAFGAIGIGTNKKSPYTEEDWSDLTQDLPAYQKSKTLSEKAAWEYIAGEGKGLELAVVNPVAVLGPVLGADYSHSIQMIHGMLKGTIKGLPNIRFPYVDVRDVADLHLRAMIQLAANGQRFLATSGKAISMLDIAGIMRAGLGVQAAKVPKKELLGWLIRLIALFNPKVKLVVPHLGIVKEASHEKASQLLGWQPRSNKDAVLATAQSLVDLGLV
ncbi:NAD-dependent epimerase/dehydratase family protein [Chitinophaga sp. CF418]|uniref:NAD-dependent epimerase/dehydratase family protein n=1 Tax=Chitinophaga sp. CF418 TaxID=1855287 RepID=UPI00092415FD|nr:aldehyde reductase [Chitinophaga sp. CF418]SHN09420.1 dihydroflavonol-4-reductase [Chitinophaga sp. CF418]